MITTVEAIAKQARDAALKLANASAESRNKALSQIAKELDENKPEIITHNKRDVKPAERYGMSKVLIKRLMFDESKIDESIRGIHAVIKLDDPIGKTLHCIEMDTNLDLYKVTCPLGVIGAIFESRPDALIQIASLCLKSGNAVILKGGSESTNTNRILIKIIENALGNMKEIPCNTIQLVETREDVKEILKLHDHIDLLIPRGSGALIKHIQENTRIPVLGHAQGICHGYVDSEADIEIAINICYDAKVQYPAVCNAMETLLVHKDIAREFLPLMMRKYEDANVELRGDTETRKILPNISNASEEEWPTEYNDLILSIKIVNSVQDAIAHINTYGSHHTDMIITSNDITARVFLDAVDSAVVLQNASTRFSDGYRFGLGSEVGISTNKIHARGPVGLEGLTIYKYIVIGKGQIVTTYTGKNAKQFSHINLEKVWKSS